MYSPSLTVKARARDADGDYANFVSRRGVGIAECGVTFHQAGLMGLSSSSVRTDSAPSHATSI